MADLGRNDLLGCLFDLALLFSPGDKPSDLA